jgi:hypothetical protein
VWPITHNGFPPRRFICLYGKTIATQIHSVIFYPFETTKKASSVSRSIKKKNLKDGITVIMLS